MALVNSSGGIKQATGIGATTTTFTLPSGNFTPGNIVVITLVATDTFNGLSIAGTTWAGGAVEDYPYGGIVVVMTAQAITNSGRNDVVISFGSGSNNKVSCSFEEYDDITALDLVATLIGSECSIS